MSAISSLNFSQLDNLKTQGLLDSQIVDIDRVIKAELECATPRTILKKSITGLARTIVIVSKEEVYVLLNSRTRGDTVLGSGAEKTLKTAFHVLKGSKVATYSLVSTEKTSQELVLRRTLAGLCGIQKAPEAVVAYESGSVSKARVFETLYDSDLSHLIKDGPVNEDLLNEVEKQKIASDLTVGLLEMHKRGFLHRDIKPENILFVKASDGTPSADLSDFGLSCHTTDSLSQLTMQGSPKYFSPEYIEYATKALEMPHEYREIEALVKQKETEILAVIDPEHKIAKFTEYHIQKYLKTATDNKVLVESLHGELKSLKQAKEKARPFKDFSQVTTFQHDIYALGLSFYALFLSKAALDDFLTQRDKDMRAEPSFEGYDIKAPIQEMIKGMLKVDPKERMSLEAALALLA